MRIIQHKRHEKFVRRRARWRPHINYAEIGAAVRRALLCLELELELELEQWKWKDIFHSAKMVSPRGSYNLYLVKKL